MQLQQFGILEKTLAVKMAVVTLVAVIVPYYLAGAAVDYLQSQIGKQQSLQAELNDVRAKRRDITTQKRLLDNHLESYQQWLARGVIAENADTTKWRNVMYDIKQKRGLTYPSPKNINISISCNIGIDIRIGNIAILAVLSLV